MARILIVEDQESIRRMLAMNLGVAGYETATAPDGLRARALLEDPAQVFQLALVDVMLPGPDGFALLPDFEARQVPVIFLTARGDLDSKVQGLRGGAEDYIVKPFEMLELLVRMEKVLARHGSRETRIRLGDVTVDTESRMVTRRGQAVSLSPMEYELFLLLVKNRNIALSRRQLLSQVWGVCYEGSTRTVDVHIAQLRKKTGLSIVSVPKVGYRLELESRQGAGTSVRLVW